MHKRPPNTFKSLLKLLFNFKFYKDIKKVIKETKDYKSSPDVHIDDFEEFLPVGSTAPDFELSTLEGDKFRLSDLRGQYVLLEFGAYT
ncbi:hypothetical protein BHF71_00205 [Vulcanibacillus modesticaldus]|uniref:Alkyl hydroperoxide reductase subunit C/ Thiol specific antioxidant domain-containing protein n=1 Tax=Vulcanibacillus modesticaldus TaxID=337097 RepID=A0A1D2YXQ8_9BACI|nr:redoxin domain-containing protein [Vulcanibacillus modesticaldus]OEG00366.1 hypothetical protein BHF71_00205 [Vulcanibacillus modesticaldus]